MGSSDAMPMRRSAIPEWRRERIIDAAMAVFSEKGVEAASMKSVAAAAGVAPGLLYHYFGGKEDLVLSVIAERGFLSELGAVLSVSEDRPAAEVLPEILTRFKLLVERRASLLMVFLSGAASSPAVRAGLTAVADQGGHLLGDYLRSRVVAGELRPHDSTAVASMLIGSFVFTALLGAPPDPADMTDVLLRGLATDQA